MRIAKRINGENWVTLSYPDYFKVYCYDRVLAKITVKECFIQYEALYMFLAGHIGDKAAKEVVAALTANRSVSYESFH